MTGPEAGIPRGRHGPALTTLAVVALAISAYLLAARIVGEPPACGPVKGCDTVAASEFATVLGLPVALYGVAFSAVLVALAVDWWRRAHRPGLYGLYAVGLVGTVGVAYLTFLEVAVIEAICIWCVGFALVVVSGWLLALVTLRSTGSA